MKLKTIIIDDEPIALEKLKSYVERVPYLELEQMFTNGAEAADYISSHEVDLIFTDIEMPDLTGLQLVENLSNGPMVIFITAYAEFAVDGFRLSAVDYLLKPFRFEDFQRAASKALELYADRNMSHTAANPSNRSVFIKVETRFIRVPLSDIRYIKGFGEYLQIYISNRKTPLLTISSFASVRGKLDSSFLQVHRSYIVNMDHVVHIERSRIVMDPEVSIPISDSYRNEFMSYLQNHSVGGSQSYRNNNS